MRRVLIARNEAHRARGTQFDESKFALSEVNDSGSKISSGILLHRMQPGASEVGPTMRFDLRNHFDSETLLASIPSPGLLCPKTLLQRSLPSSL